MNFFSWHFPLHEFFLGYFPTPPPITFLMVRPLGQSRTNNFNFTLATLRLRGRQGRDVVKVVVKVYCGTVLGTHFQHSGKFVPQNSPTMQLDNHLDPVSCATSKWIIPPKSRLLCVNRNPIRYSARQELSAIVWTWSESGNYLSSLFDRYSRVRSLPLTMKWSSSLFDTQSRPTVFVCSRWTRTSRSACEWNCMAVI